MRGVLIFLAIPSLAFDIEEIWSWGIIIVGREGSQVRLHLRERGEIEQTNTN